MIRVRPTVKTLKALNQLDRLPESVKTPYLEARRTEDEVAKIGWLSQACIAAEQDVALLSYCADRFRASRFEQHRAMSAEAHLPVFEARDTVSPAIRGAVIYDESTDCYWLIHVDRHDEFHKSGATKIKGLKAAGSLGPSSADVKILEHARQEELWADFRVATLRALIDALRGSLEGRSEKAFTVCFPQTDNVYELSVSVDAVADDAWLESRPEADFDMVVLIIPAERMSPLDLQELLRTCVPFVQPDECLIEARYGKNYEAHMVVARGKIHQILGTASHELPTQRCDPPAPSVIHYTHKNSLTRAYVEGLAVEAVCGRWWVPVGDDKTHAHLEVCPDCAREEPIAQFFYDLQQGRIAIDR
ncbi:DUF3039 domain-containing protein [Corynebacterium cystitidis]|uniref:DUF3039 domain-containing protein n=1 Tax=Corynebacterium cystitidis DSM 20524 TaxID=1121357 RepID=A0A1H9R0Z8_9CORY|nr:DUF3039 domain-containing protein [Corynebacterium cystitidis]WJY81583.1 hypothetical protein CCYS_03080 [Corynebacterium cystitidis DSM 20524]SER66511.1 Protein of unknown function [Corynebacterium cystitidis DSM 20524]SNV85915.1 Protein of uncharacterised function (DUF3039) [Corynebacterium cystitidis]